ncbi:hypothetical protein AABB24_036426, partial [Solanum stoloniferum]
MSSSSQYYHLFICLFLLSFSSLINSEEDIVITVSNQAPNTVKAKCSLEGSAPTGDILLESRQVYTLVIPFEPKGNNTFSCEMKLREKHGVFKLFDSNDTKTCHDRDEACEWKILEEGLCMLASSDCVMFKWDTAHYSFRKITSEPIKYVARNAMRY